MNIGRWAARHGVFVAMIFLFLGVWGVYGLRQLPLDLFPEMELPSLSVIVVYPGASATDVEDRVTQVVEDAVSSLPGIKDVQSVSSDNVGAVTCIFDFGTNLDESANDIRDRLALVRRDLPSGIEEPMFLKFDVSILPVMMVMVTVPGGRVDEYYETVRLLVKERLQHIEGVGTVMIMNPAPDEVHVDVNRGRLEQYGISLAQLGGAIQAQNLSIPMGTLVVGDTDYTVRLPGEFRDLEDLRDLVVGASPSGGVVRLRDVAEVSIQPPEQEAVAMLDGAPALMLMVQKRSGANTVAVADAVKAELDGLNRSLPHGLKAVVAMDTSRFVRLMIDTLTDSLIVGAILVIVVVFLFLRRLRSSLIVALTIPASMMVAFAILYFAGSTLNIISLMAFVLAVGMVVDNAIVVLENITRHLEADKDRETAVVEGTREVAGAVTASTITTVVVFAPLVLVSGIIGIMFKELAFVMISTIGASLLASLLLTPMVSARLLRTAAETRPPRTWFGRAVGWVQDVTERGYRGLENGYGAACGWAVRHKIAIIVLALALAALTVAVVRTQGTDFLPQMDSGEILITGKLPVGTATERTTDVAGEVERILREEAGSDLVLAYRRAGRSAEGIGVTMGMQEGTHIFMVGARLKPAGERAQGSVSDIAERVRRRLDRIPDLVNYQVQTQPMLATMVLGGQKPITVEVRGARLDELAKAAEKVREVVAGVSGTREVSAEGLELRPELQVRLDRLRSSILGVNSAMAGDALRTSLYGAAKGTYRGAGIRAEEADIVVRLRKEERDSIADIEQFSVPSVTGAQVRVTNMGDVRETQAPLEIRRKNRERMLTVTAYPAGRALEDIAADLRRGVDALDLPEGVSVAFGGDIKQQQETGADLRVIMLFAMLLVYMVMACQYGTLRDPLVVMFSVPFAVTGVFLGLPAVGLRGSLISMLGIVMLMGIVVNNAIVLVDYINLMRREHGMSVLDAVVTTARRRLRPILITTLTTIMGMVPMAVATGEGHELWQQLGVAMIAGLTISTLVTLFLVPVVYVLFHYGAVRREHKAAEPQA